MLAGSNKLAQGRLTARVRELGIELPEAPSPLGAYVETSRQGNLLFLSGMLPLVQGKLPFAGRFGEDLTVAQGREAAKLAALNALAIASNHPQGLDRVSGLVRLGVSMVTTPGFVDHVPVADAASELFAAIFGNVPGHTRLICGVQSLPIGTPLVLELIFRLDESGLLAPPAEKS
jgi:enamine deaminase RidA (YjgF/YER057c/UK114 family)